MDLKDFVSETLVSIITGISDAQVKTVDLRANVNPGGLRRTTSKIDNNSIWDPDTNNFAKNIIFDVAITAEDTAKGGAKVKVLSGILGGDIGGEKGSKNSVASRVQFSVPVLFPVSHKGED